jgi:hypothetical protein
MPEDGAANDVVTEVRITAVASKIVRVMIGLL